MAVRKFATCQWGYIREPLLIKNIPPISRNCPSSEQRVLAAALQATSKERMYFYHENITSFNPELSHTHAGMNVNKSIFDHSYFHDSRLDSRDKNMLKIVGWIPLGGGPG
jgi:hypothetical protein